MTKQQMFELLARKAHLTKKVHVTLSKLLEEVKRALSKGEKVVCLALELLK